MININNSMVKKLLYYGKIKGNPHGENAMWKVVYNDNEWSLSGYPDNKVEISEWTEIY